VSGNVPDAPFQGVHIRKCPCGVAFTSSEPPELGALCPRCKEELNAKQSSQSQKR